MTDEKYGPSGLSLPDNLATFKLQIIPKMDDTEKVKIANKIYDEIKAKNIGVILDDRENLSIGAKIKDTKILGTPYLVVIGDKQEGENVEVENTKTGETETIKIEDLINKF